jgi:hypothetical protein
VADVKVGEEGADALGQLLRAYGDSVGLSARARIDVARRERLRTGLEREGVSVSARAAEVLADGLAGGRLGITDRNLYLINDGGAGVTAKCRCKRGSGGCKVTIVAGSVLCDRATNSKCKSCGFRLGISINTVAAFAGKPAQLGAMFVERLPGGYAEAVNELADLSYPVVDRVSFWEQRKRRSQGAGAALLSQLSFPLLTLADALDRLFSGTDSASSGRPSVNLMRSAVGDYPTWLTRNLANAIVGGAVEVDEKRRGLTVAARRKRASGVTIDVECFCSGLIGTCDLIYTEDRLSCSSGTCAGACFMFVEVPAEAMTGLDARFALE